MVLLNKLKRKIFTPSIFNTKVLSKDKGSTKCFIKNANKKEVQKTDLTTSEVKIAEVKITNELLDSSNDDYKYSPYLKPLEIKGIKRADRKYDYNSSYSFMKSQKDYNDHLVKPNIFVKYLYNGMKTPLPPKKYKIAEYIDVRLDMFAPFIIAGVMSLPFFIFPCL